MAALGIADKLRSTIVQRYWIEREAGTGVERLLRRACEIAGMECRWVSLSQCYPMDLEALLQELSDKPGIIVLDEFDRSDQFLVDLATFMMLYYEYRKMLTSKSTGIGVPVNWKFVIITEPRARIPSHELYKLLERIS
jgi:hypothetical protein